MPIRLAKNDQKTRTTLVDHEIVREGLAFDSQADQHARTVLPYDAPELSVGHLRVERFPHAGHARELLTGLCVRHDEERLALERAALELVLARLEDGRPDDEVLLDLDRRLGAVVRVFVGGLRDCADRQQ